AARTRPAASARGGSGASGRARCRRASLPGLPEPVPLRGAADQLLRPLRGDAQVDLGRRGQLRQEPARPDDEGRALPPVLRQLVQERPGRPDHRLEGRPDPGGRGPDARVVLVDVAAGGLQVRHPELQRLAVARRPEPHDQIDPVGPHVGPAAEREARCERPRRLHLLDPHAEVAGADLLADLPAGPDRVQLRRPQLGHEGVQPHRAREQRRAADPGAALQQCLPHVHGPLTVGLGADAPGSGPGCSVIGATGRVSRPASTSFSRWTIQLKSLSVNPCSYFHLRSPTVSFRGESAGPIFHMTDASTGSPGCTASVSAPPAVPSTSSGFTHLPVFVSATTPSASPPGPSCSVSLPRFSTRIRTMRKRSRSDPNPASAVPIRASRTVTVNNPRSSAFPGCFTGCLGVSFSPPVTQSTAAMTASTPSTHNGTPQRRTGRFRSPGPEGGGTASYA